MDHPGQPWGNSRSPPVPWPHMAHRQPALWAFCRDDYSSKPPPHPHACFIPFYITSPTGLSGNCFQPALHIWIFYFFQHLHAFNTGIFRITRPVWICKVSGLRLEEPDRPLNSRPVGLLRYRSGVDADAGNGSERACPPADLFTEVKTEMTDCLSVSWPECNFSSDDWLLCRCILFILHDCHSCFGFWRFVVFLGFFRNGCQM